MPLPTITVYFKTKLENLASKRNYCVIHLLLKNNYDFF